MTTQCNHINASTALKSHERGFSLLELAVVLAIVGVIGVTSILAYSEQHDHAKWKESEAKLALVKKAVLKFSKLNKFVPCPDDNGNGSESRTVKYGRIPAIPATPATPAVPGNASSPTIPAIPATPAQPAIPHIPVSTCTADSGTVPYATIGLSKADVSDSWGYPFIYAVDQGVTSADNMLDCPTDTACFFNRDPVPSLPPSKVFPGSVLPAFNLTTLPFNGVLGANNLELCDSAVCSDDLADGLVVMIVALNQNGAVTTGLSADEAENRDSNKRFVQTDYSRSPFFDDLLIGISAIELKQRADMEAYETVNTVTPTGPTLKSGSNFLAGGSDKSIGDVGDNNSSSQNVQTASVSETINFGAENAGKTVVLTLDTRAYGSWDQPHSPSSSTTSDQAFISANGNVLETLAYDSSAGDNTGTTTFYDPAKGEVTGQYWDASHEYEVVLDENGDANLGFAVATTGTDEQVDFTNIQLVLYGTPPLIPDFPSVAPISGVSQTEGLQ